MRPSIEKQLEEMPNSEKKEMGYSLCTKLTKALDEELDIKEEVVGLASAYIGGDSAATHKTGIIAVTPERVVFGSMGPGVSSSTPDFEGWRWSRVNGSRDNRPLFGGVELYLRVDGTERKFNVGSSKGPSKEWAQERICKQIAKRAKRGPGSAFA